MRGFIIHNYAQISDNETNLLLFYNIGILERNSFIAVNAVIPLLDNQKMSQIQNRFYFQESLPSKAIGQLTTPSGSLVESSTTPSSPSSRTSATTSWRTVSRSAFRWSTRRIRRQIFTSKRNWSTASVRRFCASNNVVYQKSLLSTVL